jgi:predicted nuclease of predicted toxin-antitoxin system
VIRLYADENVDDRIVRGLRQRGVDVMTAVWAGMTGKPDEEQLSYAFQTGSVLLTSDQDFLRLHLQWMREGKPHAGIIYYSQSHVSV